MLGRIAFLSVFLVLLGCGNYQELKQAPFDSGSEALKGGTLSFATVKAAVFSPYCLACHSSSGGNRGGVNLESYVQTKLHLASIRQAVLSNAMPMGGPPLPQMERELLFAWLDAGAPETSTLPIPGEENGPPTPAPTPSPPPSPTPSLVDFEFVKTHIFQPHCVRCHAGFSQYGTVKASLASIEGAIVNNRMPLGGGPLPSHLKDLLSEWIRNGAPEFSNGESGGGPVPTPCEENGQDDLEMSKRGNKGECDDQ